MTKRIKDKKRHTKHTHKAKDRVTRPTLKSGGELRSFRRVMSSCSITVNTVMVATVNLSK